MVHITITLSPLLFNIGFRDYYSNNKYLLKTYYVAGTNLGTGVMALHKIGKAQVEEAANK